MFAVGYAIHIAADVIDQFHKLNDTISIYIDLIRFFTKTLQQGIGKDAGAVEFMELVDYVSSYVNSVTNGEQTPWLSRKELFGDLPVVTVQ